ncbi:MAG: PRD domain-containing protein [Propionibacteriaceae bacterium]|nr:PRD domain-containing protein [Propionibacteriaceae bacterium]
MMYIRWILSNNAVIAEADGGEVVALGPGIGSRHKRGEELPESEVERIFRPSPTEPIERLSAFLAELPTAHLEAALEICELATAQLSIPLGQAPVIAIADHLDFAIRRQQEELRVEYPLAWEITQLYPDHTAIGRQAIRIVEHRLGVRLPDEEAVSFAMHLINAQAATDPGSLPGARQLALVGQVFDVIESSFGIAVDRESMSSARFVTHLRYVFARIERHAQLGDTPNELLGSIGENFSEELACAHRIAYLIRLGLGTGVSTDEVAFVALHVARLVGDARGG